MSSRIVINKGSDVTFSIFVVKENGRPYSLDLLTTAKLKLPLQNGGALEVSNATTPATNSFIAYEGVTYTATTPGIIGNSITLVFDGIKDIATVVGDWNTANPTNLVSSNDPLETDVPGVGSASLSAGIDPYKKIDVVGNPVLGELQVILPESDTTLLKLGTSLTMELTTIKGISPQGEVKIIPLRESLDVEATFF